MKFKKTESGDPLYVFFTSDCGEFRVTLSLCWIVSRYYASVKIEGPTISKPGGAWKKIHDGSLKTKKEAIGVIENYKETRDA